MFWCYNPDDMKQILKRTAIGLSIIIVLITTLATGATLQRDYGVNPPKQPPVVDLHRLFTIINRERAADNHKLVVETAALDASAAAHCADMVKQDYYSHNNPEGLKPTVWIGAQHVKYLMWGENIEYGRTAASDVATAFYNSPDHKANTLSLVFDQVGLATCSPKKYPNMVVEQFVQTPVNVL